MEAGNKKLLKLAESFKVEVEKEIASSELKTSIEFVAHLSERSDDYRFWFWMSVLVPGICDYLFAVELSERFSPQLSIGISVLLCVWVFGVFFLNWHLYLVPKKEKQAKVEAQARLAFLEHEVFATRRRSGILIYLSLLEKSVFILADKGFDSHVKTEEWAKLGVELAKNFNEKSPGKTFIQALRALVDRLALVFPPNDDGTNELKDNIRFNK